eukprot:m51a1_g583 putative C-tail anchored protein (415) ;mRNA; r:4046-6069
MAKHAGLPISSLYRFDTHRDLLGQLRTPRPLPPGAFGEVYRATRLADGCECALKAMRPDQLTPAQLSAYLHCWRKLDHPNIVKLYEVLETPGKVYLSMELCKGGNLLDKLSHAEHYSESRARRIAQQLTSAVAYMHSRGVIHRDLKARNARPLENLLLADSGDDAVIKIVDFDLGCHVDDRDELTQFVGTPCYLAPEILKCATAPAPYGKECDLWSLGVIIYVLLSGSLPFTPPTSMDDSWKRDTLNATFQFPDDAWSSVSQEAQNLIAHLLVANPAYRLTAQEVSSHRWLTARLADRELSSPLRGFASFNARRNLRVAMNAAVACQKLSSFGQKTYTPIRHLRRNCSYLSPEIVVAAKLTPLRGEISPSPSPRGKESREDSRHAAFCTVIKFLVLFMLNIPVLWALKKIPVTI